MPLNVFEGGRASSPGKQTVAGSILKPAHSYGGDLVMKRILRPFSPFR